MSDTITITGNIVAAPQQRQLPHGGQVTSFSVASTHRRFDAAQKEWVDQYTNFYDVQAFRTLGEHAFQSLRGGQRVVVVGRQRLREWESGEKRGKSLEIEADAVGHDLLWGTTVFTKDESHRRGEMPSPADDAWSVSSTTPSDRAESGSWPVVGSASDGSGGGDGDSDADASTHPTPALAGSERPF